MEVTAKVVGDLTGEESADILIHMTHPGSEFQQEVRNRHGSQTPIALVRSREHGLAAWVATHEWRGMQTLEGFTRPEARRRGFARLAAAVLVADGRVDPHRETAVFSPDCIGISQHVGCKKVRVYERRDEDWREIS